MNKIIREAQMVFALSKLYIIQRAVYICKTVYGFIPHWMEGMYEMIGAHIGVTEGMILIMDPVWVAGLKPEEFAGPIYHESIHVIREHHPRIQRLIGLTPTDFERYLANLAADFTANPWLASHNWWLPKGAAFPKNYGLADNLMFEEYFFKLKELAKPQDMEGAGFASGKCGGISGNPISKELEAELDKAKGRGAADKIRIRNETIQDIRQYIQQGGGIGNLPGRFGDLIPFKHKETITPWDQELNEIVLTSWENMVRGSADFSLRRPSKRSYTRGIIRPGLVDYQPEIVLIEDTSASMGTEEIQTARNEEIAIMEALGIDEVWLIQADVDLAVEPKRIRLADIPELKTHGRGGTDFRPALAACQELEPHPDLAIYLTDGWGPAPEDPPDDMEVIWVLVPQEGGSKPADWGHLVVVSNDPEERARFGLAA